MVKSIFLQDGEEIFVDDEDYERVNQHLWLKVFDSFGVRYIVTNIDEKSFYLPSFILSGATQKEKNNHFTRKNLSLVNRSRYKRPGRGSASQYKGVYFNKSRETWMAGISVDGKENYLGSFASEEEAAKAYNKAVDDYWGGDGFKNIIGVDSRIGNPTYKPTNTVHRRENSTGFKGVGAHKEYFFSHIHYKNKSVRIGYFDSREKAALTFNKCALYIHGDRAILNDVPMTDELQEFIDNWEIPERVKDLQLQRIGELVEEVAGQMKRLGKDMITEGEKLKKENKQ